MSSIDILFLRNRSPRYESNFISFNGSTFSISSFITGGGGGEEIHPLYIIVFVYSLSFLVQEDSIPQSLDGVLIHISER